jgi:hypothetical protein
MKIGLSLALGLGLSLLSSCSSEPTAPTQGTLNLSLVTPNSDDGAVLFTISGGPVDTVEAVGFPVYSARVDANTLRIIVTGELGSGPVARIRIADGRQLSRYTATINQVAVRATYLQRDPSSYSLTLSP